MTREARNELERELQFERARLIAIRDILGFDISNEDKLVTIDKLLSLDASEN